ncbi:PBS lyase HEAT domain protein repeat-containing protein [Stanieria cyanosphaera PCC 7437]|uniref:PBS lyase HEAT domain protein repeat-containing protein n=1 Tax=Stanieria cyanosphaera (strain ATCC 29371 / PCC 7437) TaxID=111780 RepID=K9XY19_STAC7|nr:HEAT repeat domain-containing protein [Stanieria cyanosphaera]AFZ36552.1 PBS lyase HEAT domain protein repeat-containing protein [Stanieria cyanosphaera PCC 7437]
MDFNLIQEYLSNSDSQKRMKAITELRNYETDIVVPLLKEKINDKEFLVRSFVAMGLGKKRNAESFAALLQMMKLDRDPNVRAEAANSLSLFGTVSIPHLVLMFEQDDHWLVRRSILAALAELDCPQELLEVCICGLHGEDQTVREACIDCLVRFANTSKQEEALAQLLALVTDQWWRTRMRVARALAKFNTPQAQEALNQLKQDEDHRVVGAVLESLI